MAGVASGYIGSVQGVSVGRSRARFVPMTGLHGNTFDSSLNQRVSPIHLQRLLITFM